MKSGGFFIAAVSHQEVFGEKRLADRSMK